MSADLMTRAGHLLWRELPEEWRYRDPPVAGEAGDLQAFLHAMGHLLDLIRGTTEQLHADSFSEAVAFPGGERKIQTWALSYLSELVGAELVAPDPAARVNELNHAVRWFKAKGTLASVDEVADVVTGIETVLREGWRLCAVTPRPDRPPFTLAPGTPPVGAATPDFRAADRPVQDPSGANPLFRLRFARKDGDGNPLPDREVFWKPRAPGGVPCFPGSYGDLSLRTPDLRAPVLGVEVGPHPRRTMIHVRPPDGLFAEGLAEVALAVSALPAPVAGVRRLTPAAIFAASGRTGPAPGRLRLRLAADLVVAANERLDMSEILLVGPARLVVRTRGLAELDGAAAPVVVLEGPGVADGLTLDAKNSLLGAITGGTGHARLEYVTVLGTTDVSVLQASDCILGPVTSNVLCKPPPGAAMSSCLRFSRAEPPALPPPPPGQDNPCAAFFGGTNTTRAVEFQPRWRCAPGQAGVLRVPEWGEPGCGVLSDEVDVAIAAGAEDDGEMGAHHGFFHMAELSALTRKLTQFLPLGQEVSLRFDPLLCLVPPTLAT